MCAVLKYGTQKQEQGNHARQFIDLQHLQSNNIEHFQEKNELGQNPLQE